MTKSTIRFPFLALLAALIMVLATTLPAFAMDAGLSAVNNSVVEQDGDLDDDLGDEDDPDGGLDGEDDQDDELEGEEDQDDDGDDPSTGYYCTQSEVQHPFGARLAERYESEYATLQDYFCQGFGWGQIMLALHTIQVSGVPTDNPVTEVPTDTLVTEVPTGTQVIIEGPITFIDLLDMRSSGLGWGQIWKELGFSGKPDQVVSPNDEDDDGLPDLVEGTSAGDEKGKPDFAGSPSDKEDKGKPETAGKPNQDNGNGKPDNPGGGNGKDKGKP